MRLIPLLIKQKYSTPLFSKPFSSMSSSSSSSSSPFIVIDPFCLRQFLPGSPAHLPLPLTPNTIVDMVNKHYKDNPTLVEGYAPFCKHLFVPNPCPSLLCAYAPLSPQTLPLLHTKYEQRTEKELPVLVRYFDKGEVTAPTAQYLDIILYSREQIAKENAAMQGKEEVGKEGEGGEKERQMKALDLNAEHSSTSSNPQWAWGIVSIKPQGVAHETPMSPMTMMRNALGVEEGGSGIPLDRKKYMESVQFWEKYASVV